MYAIRSYYEFVHYPRDEIPAFEAGDASIRLIIGEAFGHVSPVKSFVDTLYLEARLPAAGRFSLRSPVPELAVYVVGGDVV